jgi:hypothetical protein
LQWTAIGVANAKERYANPAAPLRFTHSAEGSYRMSASGPPYWVIPFPGLVLDKSRYGLGAMGEVFNCPNYKPGSRYRKITLVRPARFRSSADGFELESPGELQLDAPEPDN